MTATLDRLVKTHGRACWYCGSKQRLEVDHKTPHGGDDDDNLLPACMRCNKTKNRLTVEEFRILIAHRLNVAVATVQFFGEAGERLSYPRVSRVKWRGDRSVLFALAGETGMDPRTVARALVEGVKSIKGYVDQERFLAAAKKLGIKVSMTARTER